MARFKELESMSYRIEAATKEEWAERALSGEKKLDEMKVTELSEHEDGSATCTFDLDDKTAAFAQELGLKLLIYCGATETSIDYVFKSILGEDTDADK